jgi:hypothetical protein
MRKVKVLLIAFLEGSQASLVCPFGKSDVWMMLIMKHWWIVIDKKKLKYSEKNLSLCPLKVLHGLAWN